MNVLVFEPKLVGHFLGFAHRSARSFARLGVNVTLAVPQRAEGSEEAAVKLAAEPSEVEIQYCLDVPGGYEQWRNGRCEAEALGRLLAHQQPDHLVVPSGDFLLCGLLARPAARRQVGKFYGDVVMHNSVAAYPRIGIRNRAWRVFDQLAASTVPKRIKLHTVDPFALSDRAAGRIRLWGQPVSYLPHFFEPASQILDRDAARQLLRLPAEARIIGSIGDLGTRKGTELLIQAFAGSRRPADAVLLLMGKMSPSARAVLAEHEDLVRDGQIIVENRFISEKEFQAFFDAIDVFWNGYPRHVGLASTLQFASASNVPIIASEYGCIGWVVEKYSLGKTYPPTVDAMTAAIEEFATNRQFAPDPQGVAKFMSECNSDAYDAALTAQFRRRFSIPAAPTVSRDAEPVRQTTGS